MAADAHKDNPLSNPDDYAHYIHRVRTKAGRLGGLAKSHRPAPMSDPTTPPKPVRRTQRLSLRNMIRFGPLRSWMKAYALWLLSQSPMPGLAQRAGQIGFLSKQKANRGHVRELESRVDFQQYLDQIGASAEATARAEYEAMFPLMTQAQRTALEAAAADPAKFKAVSRTIEGMTERIWPRKAPEAETKKIVHIHLSGAQAAAIAQQQQAEIPEAEITLIQPPQDEPTTAER